MQQGLSRGRTKRRGWMVIWPRALRRSGFPSPPKRPSAHGGMVVWSHFLHQKRFRDELSKALPPAPAGPNTDAPTDIARGYLGGLLPGAETLSRVAVWSRAQGKPILRRAFHRKEVRE